MKRLILFSSIFLILFVYGVDAASFDCLSWSRGDVNFDGVVDISDVTFGLSFLFSSGSEPECLSSADVNFDGVVDISDSVYLLNYLFLGGPAPKSPYPDKTCSSSSGCICGSCFGNVKNSGKYDKVAFIVSDEDWKKVIGLVPVSTWEENGAKYSPVFVYHKKNEMVNFDFAKSCTKSLDCSLLSISTLEESYPLPACSANIAGKYCTDSVSAPEGALQVGQEIEFRIRVKAPEVISSIASLYVYLPTIEDYFEIRSNFQPTPNAVGKNYMLPGEVKEVVLKVKHSPNTFYLDSIRQSLKNYAPTKVYVVGGVSDSVNSLLSSYAVEKISGNFDSLVGFWSSVDDVVIADSYENSLMGSVYASVLNAPFFAGNNNDLKKLLPFLTGKKVHLIGSFGNVDFLNGKAKEVETLLSSELLKKYQSMTGSDKLMLVNPDDSRPLVTDYSTKIFGGQSIVAPFLAAAKKEAIITTKARDYGSVRHDVKDSYFSLAKKVGECAHGDDSCSDGYSGYDSYPLKYVENEVRINLESASVINIQSDGRNSLFVSECPTGSTQIYNGINPSFFIDVRCSDSYGFFGKMVNLEFNFNNLGITSLRIIFPESIKIYGMSILDISTMDAFKNWKLRTALFSEFIGERKSEIINFPFYSSNDFSFLKMAEKSAVKFYSPIDKLNIESVANWFLYKSESVNGELNVIPLKIVNYGSDVLKNARISVYAQYKVCNGVGTETKTCEFKLIPQSATCSGEHCATTFSLGDIPANSMVNYDFNFLPDSSLMINSIYGSLLVSPLLKIILEADSIEPIEVYMAFKSWSEFEEINEDDCLIDYGIGATCASRFVVGGSSRYETIVASSVLSTLNLKGVFADCGAESTEVNIMSGSFSSQLHIPCYDSNKIFIDPAKFSFTQDFPQEIFSGDSLRFSFNGKFIARSDVPVLSLQKKLMFSEGGEDSWSKPIATYSCSALESCATGFSSFLPEGKFTLQTSSVFDADSSKTYLLKISGASNSEYGEVLISSEGFSTKLYLNKISSEKVIEIPGSAVVGGKLRVELNSFTFFWADLTLYEKPFNYFTIFGSRDFIPLVIEGGTGYIDYSTGEMKNLPRSADVFYADFNDDLLPDLFVGRIEGVSLGDVSSYVVRDILSLIVPKKKAAGFIGAAIDLGDLRMEKLGMDYRANGYKSDIYTCDGSCTSVTAACCVQVPACKNVFAPNFDSLITGNNQEMVRQIYSGKDIVMFSGHGFGSGQIGGLQWNNIPQMSNTFILSSACATCVEFNRMSLCHLILRNGALGYIGAISSSTPMHFTEFLNQAYYLENSVGEGMEKGSFGFPPDAF